MPKRRIRKKTSGETRGRKPTFEARARFKISMEAPQLARAHECADEAGMPLSDWIAGIVLKEIEYANRKKLIEDTKKEET
jgi:hypothetical protein